MILITTEDNCIIDSPMRSRSIDNYLSQEEGNLITAFVIHSIERFENYNGRIRMTPQRFKTNELQELYIKKYNQWENAVKTRVPNSSSTYLNRLRESDKSNPCPIEKFLKSFMQIIQQAIPPSKQSYMLQKLEVDLMECGFFCPCPAEPEY
jgi:hypothetical protein